MLIDDFNIATAEKSGIPKIEIPVRLKDLDKETIKYYLPDCISLLEKNAKKIKKLKAFVDGTYQDIDKYEYGDNSSGKARNKIKENHAYEIVQFKEGFLLGDKKQFANKENVNNDDMTYLDKFLSDVNYYTKDLELRHNIYATGIGTSFIMPRGDIFTDTLVGEERQVKYATDYYDVNVNSPFIYETVNSEENAVVYSSCIGESGLKDLFCFNVANVFNRVTQTTEKVVTVYTREKVYEYRTANGLNELREIADNIIYGELPMTEHALNNTRTSPIEIVYDPLNAVNKILSNEVNSLEDKVNQLLVFFGCDVDQDSIDNLYKNGIICVPTDKARGENAKIDTITNDLLFSETNVLMERVLTRIFDIVGVPLASAVVSSGNNEAAYLGGGWTNASTIINRDILYFEQADREELRKEIKICKLNPDNPINEINANEIDIKYNVNQSNNFLVKTQGMQNLYDIGVPIPDIVKVSQLFGDIHTVSKRWDDNLKENLEIRGKSSSTATGDNLTGQQKAQNAAITQANQATNV